MSHLFYWAGLGFALVIPFLLVWRGGFRGAVKGALWCWGLLVASRLLASFFDDEVELGVTLLYGWTLGLFYTITLWYLLRKRAPWSGARSET